MLSKNKEIAVALAVLLVSLAAVAGFLWFSRSPEGDNFGTQPQHNLESRELQIGGTVVGAEVAKSPAAHRQGLSGRESLAQNAGMLFVFDESATHAFWMKDMSFALDIIWLDKNRTIVDIAEYIRPETYPQKFTPDHPARYALEVNAGFVDTHGVSVGDTAEFKNDD